VWVLGVCRYPLALFVLLALWVAVKGRTQTNTPLSGSDYRSLVVTSAVLCGGLPLVQVRRQGSEEGGGACTPHTRLPRTHMRCRSHRLNLSYRAGPSPNYLAAAASFVQPSSRLFACLLVKGATTALQENPFPSPAPHSPRWTRPLSRCVTCAPAPHAPPVVHAVCHAGVTC